MTVEEYQEKKQAKIDRYRDLADKNKNEAENLWNQGSNMASVIPFGQPILVGHHSENRDRNYRNKIDNKFRKSIEIEEKATYYEEKAERMESNSTIFTDDPEAGGKLAEKIKRLENNQIIMKSANKIIKSNKPDAVKIDELVKLNFTESQAVKLLNPTNFGGAGFPCFTLTNNNANINRLKKRLNYVEKLASVGTSEIEINGIKIVDNQDQNRLQIFFPDIPSPEVRSELKHSGFRWSPTNKAWQSYRSASANWKAKQIVNKLNEVKNGLE